MALFGRKTRRADDHVDAVRYAGFGIFKNDSRRRKINDDVRFDILKGFGKIAFDGKAQMADTGDFPDIFSDVSNADTAGNGQFRIFKDGFDDLASHAAVCPID